MVSSEDLVPTGQPYGQRQANVEMMRQAEVPLSSEGGAVGSSRPLGAQQTVASAAAPPSRSGGFDALAGRSPGLLAGGGAMPAVPTFRDQLKASPNPLAQKIAELLDYYEGA